MRTDEEIISTLRGAFAPLRCDAQDWDHGAKIRFRVFDPDDQPLIRFPKLNMGDARSASLLTGVIGAVRARIEARGFTLEPWSLSENAG